MTKVWAVTIEETEEKIIVEKEKNDVYLPMIAGFKRKEGSYDNLWDWKTLVDYKIEKNGRIKRKEETNGRD